MLCTTVVHSDTHTYEQFKLTVGLDFSLLFAFFATLFPYCLCGVGRETLKTELHLFD